MQDFITDEDVLLSYRLQLLPYLKSFYVYFKQILAELSSDNGSSRVQIADFAKYFFKIWSVINYLAMIRESSDSMHEDSKQ